MILKDTLIGVDKRMVYLNFTSLKRILLFYFLCRKNKIVCFKLFEKYNHE